MGKHLSLGDRQTIEIQLGRGSKQNEIAKVLKRDPSLISMEIKRNSVKKRGSNKLEYLAIEADIKPSQKRWGAKRQSMKINMNIINSEKEKYGIKSVTFDNGMEFAFHKMLQENRIDTFFCEPYHSREKGSIENLNRIIRRWFPKGTDSTDYTQEDIEKVCRIIADSPREILGFLSPNQVHFT